MAAEPVNAWDARCLVAGETTFGTVPNPAAAQAFEFISIDTGGAEAQQFRPQKDRHIGRGMQKAFVPGRVAAMPWSIESSVKARAAVDTVPAESALMKAAGLTQTVNGSTNVTYSLPASPQADGSLVSASIYRALGAGTGTTSSRYFAEQLRGCIVKETTWAGGDRELTQKWTGDAIGKYHLGYSSSVTLANGSVTSLVFANAEEGYRFGLGWYQIESEVVQITAMNYSTFTATITRGALSTSGAAHSAVPMVPYLPTVSFASAGAPISEVNCTVTIDSQVIRFTGFTITLTTGIEMGPGETGSKYIQTPIVKRYDIKVSLKGVVRREDIALFGKATQQKTPIAVSIVCGTGAGGIVTFSLPYCEVDAPSIPDKANDVAEWGSLNLRVRDSTTGNDAMTVVYT